MGQVAVLFRLMPQGVETDMKALAEGVRAAVPAGVTLRGMQVKDIAYGLKALLVAVVMNDQGGVLDQTEEALAKVPQVESVEVMEEGLL
ncbi:MAG: elongation factor 1-beta [Thermoplasmata archaeon]|jgi:elongation factor 1-beta|nr:elongation factor 1-beta [Thermoplasmata archaeon]